MPTTPTHRCYDVIVIGAGHAGCEAALAAARSGCRTLVLTSNLDRVGFMPCNPSIGGPGKSHIVAEIDALGGAMAVSADRALLQVRCLNTSKGPAVRAIRAQEDKVLYALAMKEALEHQSNLELCQDEVIALHSDAGSDGRARVSGIEARASGVVRAAAVVVTAGTFLRGALISGETRTSGGRAGDQADAELAGALRGGGFRLRRLKTGTPPRIDVRTVDFRHAEEQPGSDTPLWLSRDGRAGRIEPLTLPPSPFHAQRFADGWRRQLSCWRVATNSTTHDVIRENLHRAPMFNGAIEGVGPRYCPSVEDKIARFGEKPSHPIFLEPEGWRTTELYVQGMSTSLPPDVQDRALRTIPALRDARITRYGYAVEYDAVDPSELTPSLETRRVAGLFFAGQINGTSGYEEAAGQGIIAGINAAGAVAGRAPFILGRHEAYIGVMIDDLVAKPFDEPYRMLTSRAEFRLSLRASTADRRLGGYASELGLVSAERAREVSKERDAVERAIDWLAGLQVNPSSAVERLFADHGLQPPGKAMTVTDLLRRPELDMTTARALVAGMFGSWPDHVASGLDEQIEETIKYGAFVEREEREVRRRTALEGRTLPPDVAYGGITGLRIEASVKLSQHRPRTIGEASRLAGVTPADIAVLLIHTARSEAAPH